MIKEHVSFTCGLMKAKHVICRQFKYTSWLYGSNHKNIKSNKQSRSSRGVMNQKEVRSQKKKILSNFLYSWTKWVSWLDEETVSLVQCLIISLFLKNFLNETRTITIGDYSMFTNLFMLQQPSNFIILWVVQDYYFFHHFCCKYSILVYLLLWPCSGVQYIRK